MDIHATLQPEMLKEAMEALLQQWSKTPANGANKRRHGETSPMTQARHALKSRFKAWARMVYGDFIILQSILITGKYSSTHVGAVAKIRAEQKFQTTYGRIVAPHTEARTHQNNRKWMRWLENQMLARGLRAPTTPLATDSAPTCCHCIAVSSSNCVICLRHLPTTLVQPVSSGQGVRQHGQLQELHRPASLEGQRQRQRQGHERPGARGEVPRDGCKGQRIC